MTSFKQRAWNGILSRAAAHGSLLVSCYQHITQIPWHRCFTRAWSLLFILYTALWTGKSTALQLVNLCITVRCKTILLAYLRFCIITVCKSKQEGIHMRVKNVTQYVSEIMQTKLGMKADYIIELTTWPLAELAKGYRAQQKCRSTLRLEVLKKESHATHSLASSLAHMFVFLGFGFWMIPCPCGDKIIKNKTFLKSEVLQLLPVCSFACLMRLFFLEVIFLQIKWV